MARMGPGRTQDEPQIGPIDTGFIYDLMQDLTFNIARRAAPSGRPCLPRCTSSGWSGVHPGLICGRSGVGRPLSTPDRPQIKPGWTQDHPTTCNTAETALARLAVLRPAAMRSNGSVASAALTGVSRDRPLPKSRRPRSHVPGAGRRARYETAQTSHYTDTVGDTPPPLGLPRTMACMAFWTSLSRS